MLRMLSALVLLCVTSQGVIADTATQHNVLFIIADDLNCDLGCYGHREVKSPNIDRLAKKGVRFDRAYVQYPVCNPSRSSFLTGLRPDTTLIFDNQRHFRKTIPDVVSLPELFRKNGYYAAGLGKVFHRGLSPDELRPDMDDPKSFEHVFYGKATATGNTGDSRNLTGGKLPWCRWRAANGTDEDQADGQLTAEAIKVLEKQKDKPFFLAVGFYRPHDPFQSPKKYFELYKREELSLPVASPAGYKPPTKFSVPGGVFKQEFDKFTAKEKREFLHAYYAGTSFVDAQVGKLLDTLDRLKLSEKTIVVFIGDHGYELGVRNWWNKNTLFERSTRTPLLVYHPGAKANGKATKAMTEFIDLYPTLAESCGLKGIPARLQGKSFRTVLDDPTKSVKEYASTVVKRGMVMGRTLRTPRYRYTEWNDGKAGVELYDHDSDPGEWKNLADDPAQVKTVERLRKTLRSLTQKDG